MTPALLIRKYLTASGNYIIPIPWPPAGAAGVSSLILATTDSVVSSVDATLVAFCSALLVTFAGSRIPAPTMSTYSSFRASKPTPGSDSLTFGSLTAWVHRMPLKALLGFIFFVNF